MLMHKTESIGPFKAMGVVLNTVGSTAVVLDNTIQTGGAVITGALEGLNLTMTKGNEALGLALTGPLEDMKADEVVASAERKVRMAKAIAEANRILATLKSEDEINE